MKIGCSSWSFHRAFESEKMDLYNFISICADELKIDGVELLDFHINEEKYQLKEVKNFIVRKGLTVSCVSASTNFGYRDEKKLSDEVSKVKHTIDLAVLLGSSIIRIFAGWEGPAPWDADYGKVRADRNEIWPRMMYCMKESAIYAEEKGIFLAVENHNHRGIIHTKEDAEAILQEVNSPWCALTLDTEGYTDEEWYDVQHIDYKDFEQTVEYAVHIHFKVMHPGNDKIDDLIDYDRIFNILQEYNYRGFVSLEYGGPEEECTAIPRVIGFIKEKVLEQS